MKYILIIHEVEDYGKWKPAYDAHKTKREQASLKELYIWRNQDKPNEISVLFEAADLDKANQFRQSDELKQAMKAAGVQGTPKIKLLDKL
ncbi:cyclase [Pontibacter oryzae]|uniref:Cyclase n=1 Tax=Pontibacter oryzae TaxID=2304593 RepID=A0A399SFG5_9BACT|nr:cyclase [Pontibacter oryzae]RIJ42380.1 cyclase [Pontibacter oryzae]